MIMQLTYAKNSQPTYINMEHVLRFEEESRGTILHLLSGGNVVVTQKSAKIYRDYCSQKNVI